MCGSGLTKAGAECTAAQVAAAADGSTAAACCVDTLRHKTPFSTLRRMSEAVCQVCLPYIISNARQETRKVYQAGEVPQAAEQH